jgi:hypothetical protein
MPLLIIGLLTYLTISTVIMLAMARAACREAPTPPPMAGQDKDKGYDNGRATLTGEKVRRA